MPYFRIANETFANAPGVVAVPTTTTLALSPAAPVAGQPVTVTATVTPPAAAGTVTFTDGGITIGSVPVAAGGAQLSGATFTIGSHTLAALFTPDSGAAFMSSSATRTVNVTAQQVAAPTSTALAVAPVSPAVVGTSVTLTATVTPSGAAGSVQFTDGGAVIGTRSVVNGTASMQTTTLPQGQHVLAATFIPTDISAWVDSTSPTAPSYQINPQPSPTMARGRAFLANRPGDIEGLAAGQLTLYDLVVCHPQYASQLAALKAAAPSTKFLVYRDEIACPNGNSDGAMSVSYVDANAGHPDWFLLDQTAARLVLADFPSNWWMDQGNLAYQNQWAANAIAQCQQQGWHGVFIDDHNSHNNGSHLAGGKSIPLYPTETANRAASQAFGVNVCQRLRAAGYYTLANTAFNFAPVGSTWQQAFTDLGAAPDGNMLEFWCYPTSTAGSNVYVDDAQGGWSYQQQRMTYGLGLGRGFFPLTYVGSAAVRDYAWSSFLLLQTGSASAFTHTPITGGTDPGTPATHGTPVGTKQAVPGSPNCYYRDFPGGTLYVNADTITRTLGGQAVPSGTAAFVPTPAGAAFNPLTYDWDALCGPDWLAIPKVIGSRTVTSATAGLTGSGTQADPWVYDGRVLGGNFRMDPAKNAVGNPLSNLAGQMATITANGDFLKFKHCHAPYWFVPGATSTTVRHHITFENCSSGIYDYFQPTAPTVNKFTGGPMSGTDTIQYWWDPATVTGRRWAPGDSVWSYAGEQWKYIQNAQPTSPQVGESWCQVLAAPGTTVMNYFRWNGTSWININSTIDPAVVGPNDGQSIAGFGCSQASDLFWNKCLVQGWEDGIYCGDNPHTKVVNGVVVTVTPPMPKSVNHKMQLTWFIGASLSRGKRDPHADLIQSTGVGKSGTVPYGLIVQRCRLDGAIGKWGYTPSFSDNRYNSAMILKCDMGDIDGILVSECLIYCANNTIYSIKGNFGGDTTGPGGEPQNAHYRNNVFDNLTRAVLIYDNVLGQLRWSGNKQINGTLLPPTSTRLSKSNLSTSGAIPVDDGDPTGEGLVLA